jgi:2-polyprenyl-6-methoxyphenol hydroxylase-like FAD-dependent oxidoreductase
MLGRVLVVGAGSAGTATAILLARAGVGVDLVELRHRLATGGSGITLQGNALRVLRAAGVWERVRGQGQAFDGLGLRAPDGALLAEIQDLRTGGEDLPATLGLPRASLALALLAEARARGVHIRLATSVERVGTDGTVVFSDGEAGRYDLVVGADGLRSRVRDLAGIRADIRPSGLGIWRVFGIRPPEITRTDLTYGGPALIAGYCPTGPDSLYAYFAEPATDRFGLTPMEALEAVRDLAAGYGGPWKAVHERMTDPRGVHYTRAEWHVLDEPWHRGRIVVAGDAAHTCPPTLAQGAAQAFEDASVLVDELCHRSPGRDVEDSLTAYAARRRPRAAAVVAASVEIAARLVAGEVDADVAGVAARTSRMLAEPP